MFVKLTDMNYIYYQQIMWAALRYCNCIFEFCDSRNYAVSLRSDIWWLRLRWGRRRGQVEFLQFGGFENKIVIRIIVFVVENNEKCEKWGGMDENRSWKKYLWFVNNKSGGVWGVIFSVTAQKSPHFTENQMTRDHQTVSWELASFLLTSNPSFASFGGRARISSADRCWASLSLTLPATRWATRFPTRDCRNC